MVKSITFVIKNAAILLNKDKDTFLGVFYLNIGEKNCDSKKI